MRYNFGPTHSPGFKPWAFKKRCIFRIGYKMVKTIKSIFSKYITHGLNRGLKECKESITVLTVLKLTNSHTHTIKYGYMPYGQRKEECR